jgi:hypothetical protein
MWLIFDKLKLIKILVFPQMWVWIFIFKKSLTCREKIEFDKCIVYIYKFDK